MSTDAFNTLVVSGEGIFRDRGSKFIGFANRLVGEDSLNQHLEEVRSLHPKARHICYAYRLGIEDPRHRLQDDGEPSGSAGRPIYDVIRSAGLHEVLITVVRYFGGTKLGIPGLIHAYKSAAADAVKNGTIDKRYLTTSLELSFPPETIGEVYNHLKQLGISDIENRFPKLRISVRKSQVASTCHQLTARFHGIHPEELDHGFKSDALMIKSVE